MRRACTAAADKGPRWHGVQQLGRKPGHGSSTRPPPWLSAGPPGGAHRPPRFPHARPAQVLQAPLVNVVAGRAAHPPPGNTRCSYTSSSRHRQSWCWHNAASSSSSCWLNTCGVRRAGRVAGMSRADATQRALRRGRQLHRSCRFPSTSQALLPLPPPLPAAPPTLPATHAHLAGWVVRRVEHQQACARAERCLELCCIDAPRGRVQLHDAAPCGGGREGGAGAEQRVAHAAGRGMHA